MGGSIKNLAPSWVVLKGRMGGTKKVESHKNRHAGPVAQLVLVEHLDFMWWGYPHVQ